jgi:hypothetical protein
MPGRGDGKAKGVTKGSLAPNGAGDRPVVLRQRRSQIDPENQA